MKDLRKRLEEAADNHTGRHFSPNERPEISSVRWEEKMKSTELQCGDLILVDGKPTRVYGVMQRMNRIYDTMTNDISMKRCEGMPLTPEILEKNGWKHSYEENRCGTLHKWHKEDGFKQFTVWKNKGRFELGELGCFPFKYLHELQHALRLCGLDELADNFKV